MSTPEPPTDSQPTAPPVRQQSFAGSGGSALRLAALVCYLITMLGLIFFLWSTLFSSMGNHRYENYSNDETISTEYSSPTPTHVPSVSKLGETIIIDGLAVTLLSIEIIHGDQIAQPRPGNVFIVTRLEFFNLTTAPLDPNPFDFHVTTGSGDYLDYHDHEVVWPATYTGAYEVGGGRLAPGDTVDSDLLVQAPIGDHAAELTWEPSPFVALGTFGWNLGLEEARRARLTRSGRGPKPPPPA